MGGRPPAPVLAPSPSGSRPPVNPYCSAMPASSFASPRSGAEAATDAAAWEAATRKLTLDAQSAAPHEVPDLIQSTARSLGFGEALAYLVDLQQTVLVPFVADDDQAAHQVVPLRVDSTVAGRAFQQSEAMTQPVVPGTATRVWLPLLNGSERLGVLAVTVPDLDDSFDAQGELGSRLQVFAALCADLVMIKTMYSDTIVTLRRTAQMGLAAEMQWSLLPPLTYSYKTVTLAGALEPAYEVAGDSLDYSVDRGVAHLAIFDGMGHGLRSSQLAAMAVAAYRNARRSGRSLSENLRGIDAAVCTLFDGTAFTTAVLAELDINTGLFSWVNAGHPSPLLIREGRLVRELIGETVLPLGLGLDVHDAEEPTAVAAEQLQPGDYVLLYTDGITEARSPEGEFFGDARLVDLLARHLAGDLPAAETMRRVVRALLDHQQGQLSDDATLLLLHWRGRP